LGLEEEITPLETRDRRIEILRGGKLRTVPSGLILLTPTRLLPVLTSSFFSWRGKIRLLAEPFVPPRRDPETDESLADFIRRRFGEEALVRLAEPVLASLLTADAERLSLHTALPQLAEMERRCGSVTRAVATALRRRKRVASGRHTALHSEAGYLKRGFGTLVDSLLGRLRGSVKTGYRAEEVRSCAAAGEPPGPWEIRARGESLRADALILACPSPQAAALLSGVDSALASELETLSYASCATVNLLYREGDLGRPLKSFGFFVPAQEGLPLVAVSFVSKKFRGRTRPGTVLLRAFLGGALRPGVLDHDDESLARLAHEELESVLPLKGAPLLAKTYRFSNALPQYEVGYPDRVRRIRERLEALPGLFLAGSALGAVGIPDCVASGESAALSAVDSIAALPQPALGASYERCAGEASRPASSPSGLPFEVSSSTSSE
jgi:oxygen-dependent protoporphyrinogen oxidase